DARLEAEIAVALAGDDHPHHAARHHELELHATTLGGHRLQRHLDQRTAGVDLLAHQVRPGRAVLQVGLARVAQRFQRLRKEEHRVTALAVHSPRPWSIGNPGPTVCPVQASCSVSAAAASRAMARAASVSVPRARVTPTRRCPATRGLPNRRSAVSGCASAAPTLPNTGTPWPSASTAQEAEGPSWRITGIGRPRMARACNANSDRSCEISVTRPVSCGRGETSENQTSSPLTKNSMPNTPRPPSAAETLPAISRARSSARADIGCGCQLSR